MSMSRKTLQNHHKAKNPGQKHVRNGDVLADSELDVETLKINLGHLVASSKVAKKVDAYEQIAAQMSALAGLNNGHSWTWRYVASFCSGSIVPSEKFLSALELLLEKFKPSTKQWFYFVHRREAIAAHVKSVRREIIISHMQAMGFKPVTFSRYMQVKRPTTRRKE
jgi:hypothetical protein